MENDFSIKDVFPIKDEFGIENDLSLMGTDPKEVMENEGKAYKANFLWPHESGTIQEAAYEFVNAGTETYRKIWYETLIDIASTPTPRAENKRLTAECERWKRHHEEMKERCALLRERHDLPVDRIPAYKKLIEYQTELCEIEKLRQQILENIDRKISFGTDELCQIFLAQNSEMNRLKSIVRQQTEALKKSVYYVKMECESEAGDINDAIELGEGV